MDHDEITRLHHKLKQDIIDEIELGSDQYNAIVNNIIGCGVKKGRCANAKTLFDKFVLLENHGKLAAGKYDVLRKIVTDSGVAELVAKINETDQAIKRLQGKVEVLLPTMLHFFRQLVNIQTYN